MFPAAGWSDSDSRGTIGKKLMNARDNFDSPNAAPVLRLKNIQKAYGEFQALVNITFELQPGELLVALGPSGCGKTTLLRIIAGLEAPSDGEIWLGDKRIDTLPPKDRDLSLVFQNYALYPHMTVAENLAFPLNITFELQPRATSNSPGCSSKVMLTNA